MSHSRAEKPEKESVAQGSRGVKEKARGRDGGDKESSEDRSEKGDAAAAKRASPAQAQDANGGWPSPNFEFLVLLGDAPLFALPLEALPFLQNDAFGSVSRDLSMQLFLKRLKLEEKVAGAH